MSDPTHAYIRPDTTHATTLPPQVRHHVATATTLDGLCDLGHVLYMF
jgi:hypothetical protein